MTPEKFVSAMIGTVLDAHVRYYRDSLENPVGATDPYWIASSALYARLSAEEREIVIAMMQQAAVDALSGVFGILDGTSTLEEDGKDFTLKYGKFGKKLNGDLQDLFLAEIQEREA